MNKQEISFLVVILATFGGFAFLIYHSLMQVTPAMPQEAIAGSKIWQKYGCMECHAVLSSGGYSARDLTKIMSLRTEKELLEFFAQPPPLLPHRRRMHVSLTKKEAANMIAYLRFVNNIDTRSWPPLPIVDGRSSKRSSTREN
ncbi:MAG: cytochrome c [Firmicutes bacterium]|nr:cytochrome c [Bacillota bacterium]